MAVLAPADLGASHEQAARVVGRRPVRAALAQQLSRPMAASIGYRFLARQGWRKVAPGHAASQERPASPGGLEKPPAVLATLLSAKDVGLGSLTVWPWIVSLST